MKLSHTIAGTLVLGLLAGCSHATMAGAGVHVAKAHDEVNGCQPISSVQSTEGSESAAETDLRNRAGRMNANWVLISDKVENGGYVNFKGTAYNCPNDMASTMKPDASRSSDGT